MTDDALRKRLDAALFLLTVTLLLVFALAFEFARDAAIGVAVLSVLVGYAFVRSG